MEGKPPPNDEEAQRREQEDAPGGWLPPVPPGSPPPPAPPPGWQQPAPGPAPQHPYGQPGAQPSAAQPFPQQPPAYVPPPTQGGYGSPPPPPGYQQPAWQQPGWQAAPAGPGNGTAVTGFVLAVSSVALLFFSAGLSSIISLGLGIAGAIVGRNGREKVDRGETTQHRGLGQAGFIVGIVGAVLSIIATVAWILLFALIDDFGDDGNVDDNENFFDDFQSSKALVAVTGAAARLFL